MRRSMIYDKPSFHPELNNMSVQIMQHKGNFSERIREFQEQKILKIKELFNEMRKKEVLDSQTGRPLFKPSLIAQPKFRNRGYKSIGEYLFEMSKNKSKE
jgi:hypothetical protein